VVAGLMLRVSESGVKSGFVNYCRRRQSLPSIAGDDDKFKKRHCDLDQSYPRYIALAI
jgi:hypothetical protein